MSKTKLPDMSWSLIEALPEDAVTGVFIYAAQAVREALAALKIDERAAFEAAVQEEYGTSAPSMLLRDADGDYLTLNTEWVFWLKRAALTAAPPKENNHAEGADQ
ncbi:hypothetical protein [Achromobacter xylosoxidans]|uniref:hypothetical protein n=1 Tax=Alcaligenes xylosoxydans xylosoxydans TaxID=85698 RepID=UPI0006C50025|nr:hypothetical protein [Achromobacter xylosoxidans]MCH4575718.1 hypothetical protein [Achromobacter xylosoxidans]NEV03883.1 hypothetical protein [Achromobacter xylosoxidans]PNL98351.1 hypothetical protein A6J83_024895 [Achromobacter xylosoxidans]CUK22004.1 Uncharacterised protein [Achromobacter xylosoxidans]